MFEFQISRNLTMQAYAFDASTLRAELDTTLLALEKGKDIPCMGIINREMHKFWDAVMPKLSSPAKVCGKSWSEGQFAYKCRTCEKDPTCVLCIDCFQIEKHVGHDYKIIRTYGGMCDCGDTDSWNPDGFCSAHPGGTHLTNESSLIPLDMLEWTQELIGFSLSALQKGIFGLSSSIEYTNLQQTIKKLAKGIEIIVNTGDLGRSLVAKAFCTGKDAILHYLMEHECSKNVEKPWEGTFAILYDLIQRLMPDQFFKLAFARSLVCNYMEICALHSVPSDSKPEKSLRDFSVQVFTVSTICKQLLDPEECGINGMHILHFVLIGGFQNLFAFKKIMEGGGSRSDNRMRYTKLAFYAEMFFNELSYILNSDVEIVRAFLNDKFLIHVFCLTLDIIQKISVVKGAEKAKAFRFDVIATLDGALEKVLKIIVHSVPALLQHGFEWGEATQMPHISDSLSDAAEESFMEEILNHISSASPKKRKRSSQVLMQESKRDRSGFQLIIEWIFKYIIKQNGCLKFSTETTKKFLPSVEHSEFAFILPFHRLYARLAAIIIRVGNVQDAQQLVPDKIDPDVLEKTFDAPVALQALRGYFYASAQSRSVCPLRALTEYYESSMQLEHDITFMQIIVCAAGPAAFSRSFRRTGTVVEDAMCTALLFHLYITIAMWRDKPPKERFEQAAINILAAGPQTHSEFLRHYENRYALYIDDDNEADEFAGVKKDDVFQSLTTRINTTNPAMYALKEEFILRASVFEADSTFADVSKLAHAKFPTAERPLLLPQIPEDGPYRNALLLLHTKMPISYIYKSVIRTALNGLPNAYVMRFAIDYLLCSIFTLDEREALWKADVDKKFNSVMDNPATFADIDPSKGDFDIGKFIMSRIAFDIPGYMKEREHLDVVWALEQYIQEPHMERKMVIDYIADFRNQDEFSECHREMSVLLKHLEPKDSNQTMEDKRAADVTDRPQIDSAKLERKRAKALEKLRQQQKVFESAENMDRATEIASSKSSEPILQLRTMENEMNDFCAQMVCVSCHEHSNDAGGLGLIAHAMHGNVLRVINHKIYPEDRESWFNLFPEELKSLQCPEGGTMHMTTCGHSIHEECLQKLMNHNHSTEAIFNGHKGSDILLPHEFLCPACSRLSSGILNTHYQGGATHRFLQCDTLHLSTEMASIAMAPHVDELELQGLAVSRSQSTLFWVHTRKIAVADFEEEDLDVLSGNQFETAVNVFGTQLALLEVQSRHDVGLVTIRKLIMLHTLLQNIINSLRTYTSESEEYKTNLKLQSSLVSLIEGEETESGLCIADFDPFTLLLQCVVRLVLSVHDGEARYKSLQTRLVRLAWERTQDVQHLYVFARQAVLIHLLLSPQSVQCTTTFTQSITDLMSEGMKMTEAFVAECTVPPILMSRSHALPLMTDTVSLPYLQNAQSNFLDLMVERHAQSCNRCEYKAPQRMICLCCGAITCFVSSCCPRECTQHAFECGGGSCFFLNISHSASGVFFVNAHTNQCALLKSPWLDVYGEQDVGCHRGRPLWKDELTIQTLNKYWLEGSVFQDTGVLVEKAWLFTSDEL